MSRTGRSERERNEMRWALAVLGAAVTNGYGASMRAVRVRRFFVIAALDDLAEVERQLRFALASWT